MSDSKICTGCREELPADAEFFWRDRHDRHPHAMTDTQRRDAHRWLTGIAAHG